MAGFAVIDLETSGLSRSAGARIIEIAIVQLDEQLHVESTWTTLVATLGDVGPTRLHHITPEMLQGAPTFHEITGDVLQRMDGRVLVAHNIMFDEKFLRSALQEVVGIELEPFPGLCTARLAQDIYQTSRLQRLESLAVSFGIPVHNLHAALPDTVLCAEVLLRLLNAASAVTREAALATSPVHVGHIDIPPTGRVHLRPVAGLSLQLDVQRAEPGALHV